MMGIKVLLRYWRSVVPVVIIFVNIYVICFPIINRWVTGRSSNITFELLPSASNREVIVLSLALSVPELLGYASDIRFEPWQAFLRTLILLSGSIANMIYLVVDCPLQIIVLAVHLKLLCSIILCLMNIFFSRNILFTKVKFNILLLSLTMAFSTSSWLLFVTTIIRPIFIFCTLSYGLSACIFVYYLYIWLRTLAKSYGNLTLEQLHTSVDLVATFLIFIGQMSITFVYYSNSHVNSFEFYIFYSILLVSILTHLAWFCHNQINRMEIDRVYVSDTTV